MARTWIVVAFCLGALVMACSSKPRGVQIVGWLEEIQVMPEGLVFHAKLDTGALNSSLDASEIEKFTRNGTHWVRFTLMDRTGKVMKLERPLTRYAKIKKSKDGKLQRRPVVSLMICLGDVQKEVEVNLVDRSHFIYEALVGRSFIKGKFAVDPAEKFTKHPQCSRSSDR